MNPFYERLLAQLDSFADAWQVCHATTPSQYARERGMAALQRELSVKVIKRDDVFELWSSKHSPPTSTVAKRCHGAVVDSNLETVSQPLNVPLNSIAKTANSFDWKRVVGMWNDSKPVWAMLCYHKGEWYVLACA
jgi:hypothetical protein